MLQVGKELNPAPGRKGTEPCSSYEKELKKLKYLRYSINVTKLK